MLNVTSGLWPLFFFLEGYLSLCYKEFDGGLMSVLCLGGRLQRADGLHVPKNESFQSCLLTYSVFLVFLLVSSLF